MTVIVFDPHDSKSHDPVQLGPSKGHGRNDSPMSRNTDLPTSANYTYLPDKHVALYGEVSPSEQGCYEEDLAVRSASRDASPFDRSEATSLTASSDDQEDGTVLMPILSHRTPTEHSKDDLSSLSPVTPRRSFARRLSRRFTPHSSRSPSPVKEDHDKDADTPLASQTPSSPPSDFASRRRSMLGRKRSSVPEPETPSAVAVVTTPLKKTLRRKTSSIATTLPPEARPTLGRRESILAKSFSVDRLSNLVDSKRHTAVGGPVPTFSIADYSNNSSSVSLNKKRDELWNVFRVLDADLTKFSAKSSTLKTNVVRQSLLPFLRTYRLHPSNTTLRAEDLDRRVIILNKWWLGLLDVLNGRNNQSLSGTDRPSILEAISGIMDRPEWRYSLTSTLSHSAAPKPDQLQRGQSSASLSSFAATSLPESVKANVRNMFVQNLSAQLIFVVEKMSLRSASASLVTFCGKAIAYAFFFCPQIAEMLVRDWKLSSDTLRRVLSEHGITKFDHLGETSTPVQARFPPAIRALSFSSLAQTMRYLRQPMQASSLPDLNGYGHWSSRWHGKESDLFFSFCKDYYLLAAEFLGPAPDRWSVICAPAMLLVQGQILATLDSTIHRAGTGVGTSFHATDAPDDIFADASTLNMPPANAHRIMAENRLVMLLREVLSEKLGEQSVARHMFATSFHNALQACARRVSVFDHTACYILCDFLEEVLLILFRYESLISEPGAVVGMQFWLEVSKKMLSSHNTMTDIRLLTFLYSMWNYICPDGPRKVEVCRQLILDDKTFFSRFTHWCPMVRAYYMRLLCWRVARFDGEETEINQVVLDMLLTKLRLTWSFFNDYQRQFTLVHNISTAPCDPAPGRRLIIVRTDSQGMQRGLSGMLGFDGKLPPVITRPQQHVAPYATMTVSPQSLYASSVASSDAESPAETDGDREAGFRGFFRGFMGHSKKATPRSAASPRALPPPSSASSSSAKSPLHGQMMRSASSIDVRTIAVDSAKAVERAPEPQKICFKFSLEYGNRPTPAGGHEMRLQCPRLPLAGQQFLEQRSEALARPASPCPPPLDSSVSVRYLGRAIAEWTLVVGECQSFLDRRRAEGVMNDRTIETPTLGMDACRR